MISFCTCTKGRGEAFKSRACVFFFITFSGSMRERERKGGERNIASQMFGLCSSFKRMNLNSHAHDNDFDIKRDKTIIIRETFGILTSKQCVRRAGKILMIFRGTEANEPEEPATHVTVSNTYEIPSVQLYNDYF